MRCWKWRNNIVIAAKTTEPNPKLPGTIYTVAIEIGAAGGRALSLAVDVREEGTVLAAVAKAVETFGGIDILANNAGAIKQLAQRGRAQVRRAPVGKEVGRQRT